MVVIGKKEKENKTVSIRRRGMENIGVMSVADFVARLKAES
jgi:threonyl-tRNA synthetase